MAKRGQPATQITVTDDQLAELNRRVAARKGPADERLRALIILGCKEGEPGTSIAKRLGINHCTNGLEVAASLCRRWTGRSE